MSIEKSQRILVGKKEICLFAGVGRDLFPELITKGFPAVFWGGKWRAHGDNIEAWMRSATLPTGPQQDVDDE